MYTLEELKALNTHYLINEEDLKKVNDLKSRIEKTTNNSRPVIGDIIVCHGYDNYKNQPVTYEKGHLDDENLYSEYGLHICVVPSVPFTLLSSKSYSFSTSGGYWFTEKNIKKFTFIDKSIKLFKTWGHLGARANGGIYFKALVSRWDYTNNENIY